MVLVGYKASAGFQRVGLVCGFKMLDWPLVFKELAWPLIGLKVSTRGVGQDKVIRRGEVLESRLGRYRQGRSLAWWLIWFLRR